MSKIYLTVNNWGNIVFVSEDKDKAIQAAIEYNKVVEKEHEECFVQYLAERGMKVGKCKYLSISDITNDEDYFDVCEFDTDTMFSRENTTYTESDEPDYHCAWFWYGSHSCWKAPEKD